MKVSPFRVNCGDNFGGRKKKEKEGLEENDD
jgi:hypothetical protein